jgi:ubiquinone/menaquinone biosynthesis C-methylase UbiE
MGYIIILFARKVNMAEANPEKQPLRQNTIPGVNRDVIWAANQYGIWDAIGSTGLETEKLFDPQDPAIYNRAKNAVLQNLRALGYVKEEEGRVEIGPDFPELLPGASFRTYILELKSWYEIVYQAPELLKRGIIPNLEQDSYDGIVEISEGLAQDLPGPIKQDFPPIIDQPMEALDIACGKLHVMRALAKQNPGLKVTGIERNPKFLRFLEETLPDEGLADRINIINGDIQSSTQQLEDQRFRMIFASHILHWITPEETIGLFKEAKRLLRPNGAFFVNEDALSDDGLNPLDSVGKNARLAALGYQVFTHQQTIEMLLEAGFSNPQSRAIDYRRVFFECFE